MPAPRYSVEDLITIRSSPLVAKPEGLPSIEQWIEQDQQVTGRKPRTQSTRTDEPAPMGNFASQRPSLLNNRHTSRTAGTDDIVLGPPKTSFASSRTSGRVLQADTTDRNSAFFDNNEEAIEDDSSKQPRGWLGDRDRASRGGRDSREAWGNARGPRTTRAGPAGDQDGTTRTGRDRPLDRSLETEPAEHDPRWTRGGNEKTSHGPGQDRGGWRDRTDNKSKRFEREREQHGRSGGFNERDPEWMDEPTRFQGEDQAHTAAEFEQWKERMKAAKGDGKDKENLASNIGVKRADEKDALPSGLASKSGGLNGLSLGGSWGESSARLEGLAASGTLESTPSRSTPAQGKVKASRFASLFNPAKEAATNTVPLHTVTSPPVEGAPLSSHEDQAGFMRMMQMLRGTAVSAGQESSLVSPPLPTPPAGPSQQRSQAPSRSPHSSQQTEDRASHAEGRSSTKRAESDTPSGGLHKDTEFLLNLIQAKGPSPGPGSAGFLSKMAPPPGFFQQPPHTGHGQDAHGGRGNHGEDGAPYVGGDRLNPTQQQHVLRPPPGFFSEGTMPGEGIQQQQQPSYGRAPPPNGFSMRDGPFPQPQQAFEDGPPPGMQGMQNFPPPGMRFPPPNGLAGPGSGPNLSGHNFMPPPPGFFGPLGHHGPGGPQPPPGFGGPHMMGSGMPPLPQHQQYSSHQQQQQQHREEMLRSPSNGHGPPPGLFGEGGRGM